MFKGRVANGCLATTFRPALPLDAAFPFSAGTTRWLAGATVCLCVSSKSLPFKLSDDSTAPTPDAEVRLEDPRYGKVRVRAWHNLHPRLHCRGRWAGDGLTPIVRGSVIRVDVERLPKPSSRANNKVLWLWWSRPAQPDLELCLHAYLHRFDLEHTYRFVKNTLGWTTPSLCTRASGPLDLDRGRRLHPTPHSPRHRR